MARAREPLRLSVVDGAQTLDNTDSALEREQPLSARILERTVGESAERRPAVNKRTAGDGARPGSHFSWRQWGGRKGARWNQMEDAI
jgi:hypothetical protein